MSDSPDDRPPLARAIAWSSLIVSIGLEMALPGAVGYWLDRKWGTTPALLILGVLLGFISVVLHLIGSVARLAEGDRKPRVSRRPNEPPD